MEFRGLLTPDWRTAQGPDGLPALVTRLHTLARLPKAPGLSDLSMSKDAILRRRTSLYNMHEEARNSDIRAAITLHQEAG